MKTLLSSFVLLLVLVTTSCSTTQRAEAKRKKELEKLEQLETDKKNFENKNRNELGK